jgi:lipoyl(octanoyl) transferase
VPAAEQLRVIPLGRLGYRAAYEEQVRHLDEVIAARAAGAAEVGRLLLVEHDPVVTVTKRAVAGGSVLAPPELLEAAGIQLYETDRGGDVTYHGPGQLVAYPILDLNLLELRLGEYMRLLETAVIDAIKPLGVGGERDPSATGVWTPSRAFGGQLAKVCAMGVRVRRWVSMHGLALNVTTNMEHFRLIRPCGLDRPVTSMRLELGENCPDQETVREALVATLTAGIAGTPGLSRKTSRWFRSS